MEQSINSANKGKEGKFRRRIRNLSITAALAGLLGTGTTSCSNSSTTKTDNNVPLDTVIYENDARYATNTEGFKVFDLPMRKSAKNPNDPDSLLVEAEKDFVYLKKGPYNLTFPTTTPAKGKYVPIDSVDKGKEVISWGYGFKEGKKGKKKDVVTVENPNARYGSDGRSNGEKIYGKKRGKPVKIKANINYTLSNDKTE